MNAAKGCRLVAPLPPCYSPANRLDKDLAVPTKEEIHAYLHDLIQFLSQHQLIQYHPENFFNYALGGKNIPEGSVHFNGTPVRPEEADKLFELCSLFDNPSIVHDDLSNLHSLIRDGPVGMSPNHPISQYFQLSKKMQLSRNRRPENDSASVSLLHGRAPPGSGSTDETKKRQKDQLVKALTQYGMNAKKQHEVEIMRSTVSDLIACCNGESAHPEQEQQQHVSVSTVVDIGEGKGYVSRVLSFVDELQIVGFDCNPNHKEKSSEREERLLAAKVSEAKKKGSSAADCGDDGGCNLHYQPRGLMACISHRVDESTDWVEVLRGHVPLQIEATGQTVPMATRPSEEGDEDDGEEEVRHRGLTCFPAKVKCKICPQVLRHDCHSALLKHARSHLERTAEPFFMNLETGEKVVVCKKHEFDEWVAELPQALVIERVQERFFTEFHARRRTELARDDEISDVGDVDASATTSSGSKHARSTRVLPRGMRATLVHWRPAAVAKKGAAKADAPGALVRSTDQVTVLGFDEGSFRHNVLVDGRHADPSQPSKARAMLKLIDLPLGHAPEDVETLEQLPPGNAYLVRAEPFAKPNVHPVLVPSLRNTIMIGLHPCGDLGSNICKLFAKSRSRGLLVVSCCWHALTESGFPISTTCKNFGLTTGSVSLMLATQPIDQWANAGSEGHRGSVRLLFFRSLLFLAWKRILLPIVDSIISSKRGEDSFGSSICSCSPQDVIGAAPPHLDPSFLRRISRDKNTITFVQFVREVFAEYIFPSESHRNFSSREEKEEESTEKKKSVPQPYSKPNAPCSDQCVWHSVSHHIGCNSAQSSLPPLPRVWSTLDELATSMLSTHFRAFVGLTVLRIWMSHLIEGLFLVDRVLYLQEMLASEVGSGDGGGDKGGLGPSVSLVPLFDGALSPRMFGLLALR